MKNIEDNADDGVSLLSVQILPDRARCHIKTVSVMADVVRTKDEKR